MHAKCVCKKTGVLVSGAGLINDVCVVGPLCAYRDVMGNGLEPWCSPPLAFSPRPKREERWMQSNREVWKWQEQWELPAAAMRREEKV